MEVVSKNFCLTETEFSVLAEAFQIKNLICYKNVENSIDEGNLQSQYDKAVWELHQKGILFPEEDHFRIKKEIADIFQLIKHAAYVITAENKDNSIPLLSFYIKELTNIVAAQPGRHKQEYIKLGIRNYEDLEMILRENGFFPDIETKEEITISDFQLEEEKEAEMCFTVFGAQDHQKLAEIKVIRHPLWDEIIFDDGKEKENYPFHSGKIMHLLKSVLEEKNHDIS